MDKALKQRLVGATVLIILTVIILPMLLSGRSDTLQQGSREIEMPEKPAEVSISKRRFPVGIPDKPAAVTDVAGERGAGDEFVDDAALDTTLVVPAADDGLPADDLNQAEDSLAVSEDLPEDSRLADEGQVEESQPDVALAAEQTEVLADDLPEEPAEKAPVVANVAVESNVNANDDNLSLMEDSSSEHRYLVQVASFSSSKRADALAVELRNSGMNVEVDVVERNAGRLHRVRVGAYASRADADAAVTKIRASHTGLAPRVVDLRPQDAAPVTAPSDPLVRWVVQVGSFSSAKSAESQVAQLRLAGLPAFTEKITSNSGSVFKVRVGPEINRDKATALAQKIAKEQNLKGFVTTQE